MSQHSEDERSEEDSDSRGDAEYKNIGIFYWKSELSRKQTVQLSHIHTYFTDDVLKTILLPIIAKQHVDGEPKLSLRAIDWLCTNYSKAHPIVYTVKPPDSCEVLINIYRSYKSWLWTFKRKNFDPFRRRTRLYFQVDDVEYQSTVGQLNFIYWASRYGVLEYARNHIDIIEKDQAHATKNAIVPEKEGRKRKRRQLSKAPKQTVNIYPTTITLNFNP